LQWRLPKSSWRGNTIKWQPTPIYKLILIFFGLAI
jgi:hypothetical protein